MALSFAGSTSRPWPMRCATSAERRPISALRELVCAAASCERSGSSSAAGTPSSPALRSQRFAAVASPRATAARASLIARLTIWSASRATPGSRGASARALST